MMNRKQRPDILIGLDPGTVTGFAVWDRSRNEFTTITSYPAWQIFDKIREWSLGDYPYKTNGLIEIWIEDARLNYLPVHLRKAEQASGAHAVRWFCGQLEAFCESVGYSYRMVKASKLKKLKSAQFKSMTGWDKATNEHGRDAAVLIWQG